MTVPVCDDLELYLDGELEDERAEAVRQHLPDCAACQERLAGAFHLEAMASLAYGGRTATATATTPATAPTPPSPRLHRPRWALRMGTAAGALAIASAAGVVLLMVRPARPVDGDWLASEETRSVEARLSYGPADRHRPYVPMRGGPDTARPPPLSAVANLEERGVLAGVAAAYLLGGDPGLADSFLQRLPPSAARESDRAAAALASGAPERALALASSALDAAPRSPQALWNRALALRDLGLLPEAARAFREAAALGEVGWGDEAARRAEALDRLARDRSREATPPLPGGESGEARLRLRAMREQARQELDAGRRARADQLLLDVVRGCRALGLDARCAEPAPER